MSDNRSVFTHLGHAFGHAANAGLKYLGYSGLETTGSYRAETKYDGKPWTTGKDWERSGYHFSQAGSKMASNSW